MTPPTRQPLVVETDFPEATRALGESIGRALHGGEVILLSGGLGAGKTLLTGGIATGLGVLGAVPSPTFLIERRHQGERLELRHWDFYRLDEESDLEELGFEERTADQVMVVEWPERMGWVFGTAPESDGIAADRCWWLRLSRPATSTEDEITSRRIEVVCPTASDWTPPTPIT